MKRLKFLLFIFPLLVSCDDDDTDDMITPETSSAMNIQTVSDFLELLTEENEDLFDFFSDNPVVTLRMNPDGSQNGEVYQGTGQVQGYFNEIFQAFSVIRIQDVRLTASEDGRSVFAQFNGDFEVEATGTPYRNVYISRVDFNEQGEIMAIEEYLNPVINGVYLGIPLGPCQEVICN